ncbi:MmgE/PrpD family protein [Marinobacter xestospongiae]|uniref:MmgE/PrpD family protein n=1 Tax=Marinobacter xestospongiae TaxID=994319 RepID=UPI002004D510|nr:MmgE/PrpD family protein [Marinobacter xestospongiae]MCK7567795.1 MmgE/PrpD family protein [Marinobacter xestospongiae]
MATTIHSVRAENQSGDLARHDQLAWKLAELATQAKSQPLDAASVEMAKNRIIDNAAIALGAANERAVVVARGEGRLVAGAGKATIWGLKGGFHPLAAAFANAVAVRFLDNDDTYLAAEYSHPDDNISPVIAAAQQAGVSGEDLLRGIIVAYEVHVALVGTGNGTGICLHKHKVDHITHIAAGTAAGISSMLGLSTEQAYHAINFAVHNAISSRQSRKGDIGAQKEFVPGFSAEIALKAVHHAMHNLKGPNPVYEGVDSIIRRFLDGRDNPEAVYRVELNDPAQAPMRNILKTYPKQHAFEYQGQAIIDLALQMREQLPRDASGNVDMAQIANIVLQTSHHTHHVIGTDANDPQKIDPDSPRGTLDHSIMFAIARCIQTGEFHKDRAYQMTADEKVALRSLMMKIETRFDQHWEDLYHDQDPNVQAYGGRMTITTKDGETITDEKTRANAHPGGDTPWQRPDYIAKLEDYTAGLVSDAERNRFLAQVDRLEQLSGEQLMEVNLVADQASLIVPETIGILDPQ